MAFHPIQFLYSILQFLLDSLLSSTPPPPHAHLSRPRIAIIGAGLTGVSSASHCVGHGFDVTIFEAGDEKSLGGIWSVSRNLTLESQNGAAAAEYLYRKSTILRASRFIV